MQTQRRIRGSLHFYRDIGSCIINLAAAAGHLSDVRVMLAWGIDKLLAGVLAAEGITW